MSSARRITIEFLGKDKSLGKTADGIEGKTSKLSDRFKKFGKVAAVGFAAAGTAAVVGGKYFLDVGSRLEQMGMKAETVFGNQLGSVEKWSKANAHAMGLTSREATGLAANFADLLIPMGFTRKQAAGMSTDVVGLSGALSQWSGGTVSAAEASDILAKAMLGETDGLKQLGISISAAEIDAELLRKGQDKLTGSALAQAKAQATQTLIMNKSTDAQEAFAKGGSPLLSAQAKMKAAFWELRDTLAVKLLPVFAKVSTWLVDKGLPAMRRLGDWMNTNLIPVFVQIGAVVKRVTGGMEGDVGGAMTSIRAIFEDVSSIVSSLWGMFGEDLIRYTKSTFANVRQIIGGALQVVSGIFKTFSSLLKGDWKGVWEGIKQTLRGAWKVIGGYVKQGWNVISTVFRVAGKALNAALGGIWKGIGRLFATGVSNLVRSVREIPGKISAVGSAMWDTGKALMGRLFDGLLAAGGSVTNFVGDIVRKIKDGINDLLDLPLTFQAPKWAGGASMTIIPAFRHGTRNAPGGPALVGEEGPEVVWLPKGSKVDTAQQTRRQARSLSGAAGGGQVVNIYVSGVLNDRDAGRAVERVLVRHFQSQGRTPAWS